MKAMKTKYLFPLAIIAAISACSREAETEITQSNESTSSVTTVRFRAAEVSTRTTFGEKEDGAYPTLWTGSDAAVKLALNFTEAGVAAIIPDEGYRTASFEADIDSEGKEAPYTFYAVSPASAATALSPSREAWNVTIPSVQTPLEASVDEAAQILAATSEPSETVPAEVNLHFNHLTAYGRFSFKNLELGDAVVEAVEMTATTPFVGNWYWNCNEGHTLTDNGASSTLTLQTSRTSDLWFACAPVDVSGEIMVFTIYTDQGALVKEVEFPANRHFTSGRIATFTVDMAGIELAEPASDEFVLVTDASVLQDGDELLILKADETYALSTTQNTNNRPATSISVSNHTISTVPSDVQILTLEAGTTSGTWYLSTGSGYLANASGSKNKLVTVSATSITSNATWTIAFTSAGVATVKAQAGDRNILRFNPNNDSPIFACYASGQQDICIFRKGGSAGTSGPVAADPITENTEYGCYLGSGLLRRYRIGVDQYSRCYDGAVQTFTLLGPNDLEQLEISGYRRGLVKGDAVTVTVTWRVGLTRFLSGRSYDMTVVKEEGPKVWLGDGSGNGFIIKK